MITVWPKGVDGRSQCGTFMRETEVRLDGWCEGGLGQQTMRERPKRVESPGTYVIDLPCVLSDRPPMISWLSHREGRDAVT